MKLLSISLLVIMLATAQLDVLIEPYLQSVTIDATTNTLSGVWCSSSGICKAESVTFISPLSSPAGTYRAMRSVSVDYRNETLLGPHILGLVSANNVRIVALDGGLFRSDDNGKSWTPLMDWQTVGGNLSGLTEARLVEGNTLYVHAYCE